MIQAVKTKIKMKRADKDGNPIYKEVEKYRYRVFYTTPIGERKRKNSKLFDTKKEAATAEAEFVANHKNQEDATGVKFYDLYIMYKSDGEKSVEESTMITKMNKIDKHILPFFKDIYIKNITPLTIRQWQTDMLNKNYEIGKGSDKVIKNYSKSYLLDLHKYLASILDYGIKYYGLKTNPAKMQGTFKNKRVAEKSEDNFYTLEEFNCFIEYVQDEYRLFFEFLYYSGCRYGEAVALTWEDLHGRTISINKSLTRKTKSGPYLIKSTKTQSSNRTIDLPKALINKLTQYKIHEERKDTFNNSWFIFGGNRPLSDTTARRRADSAMAAAGLKHITIHGFRHSHASLLINGGMNIKLISERLGHSSVTETLDTYTHMFPDQRDICVDYLDKILENA